MARAWSASPWRIEPCGPVEHVVSVSGDAGWQDVARVGPWWPHNDEAVERANARLISAAPDLFEALASLMDEVGTAANGGHQIHTPGRDAARRALAKAEGR